MDEILIEPLAPKHFSGIKDLADRYIGTGYYQISDLKEVLAKSTKNSLNYSWVLLLKQKVCGIRFTFPPGNWSKERKLHTDKWPHPLKDTAYFQTITLANEITGQGYGRLLSAKSIEQLIESGVKGIAAHSWNESPHNSSKRYLDRLGFKEIADCPSYWKDIDYLCIVCKQNPCTCNAREMYFDLTTYKRKN